MNIDSLRIFREVARQKSFTRAAANLRMTQPAASMAVQNLEKELGHQLFDRSHRPPILTPAGESFYKASRDILDRFDEATAEMQALGAEVVGSVHVASIYSVGLYHTEAIRRFMEQFPKAKVRLSYLRPNLVVEAVLRGEAHLGLISYPKETRELSVIPWKEETMVAVCYPGHRLASRQVVNFTELAGENFIAFDPDLDIRDHVDAMLRRNRVEVRAVMEFDNIETMKQAVQVGSGITILPEATVQAEATAGSLVAVRIEPHELVRPVGIILRKDKPLFLAARKFVEILAGPSALADAELEPAAATKPKLPRKHSKRQTA